jgi:predicted alpha/beta-hydrolase family hydrolase
MKPWLTGLQRRGFGARAVGLPVRKAEEVTEVYRGQVDDLSTSVIGGHSYGGRVASLLAADEPPRALVLLSYPLHRPGHPEQPRTEHWPRIKCPVLLLSGEADPFARIALLRDEVAKLSDAHLVTYPGIGHGLLKVKDDALDQIARFVTGLG